MNTLFSSKNDVFLFIYQDGTKESSENLTGPRWLVKIAAPAPALTFLQSVSGGVRADGGGGGEGRQNDVKGGGRGRCFSEGGGAHCDVSGSLIDRCRQGSWQQVDCSYFSCTVEGGGGRGEKTTSSVTNLWAFRVQRHRLKKGNEEVVCVCERVRE